MKKTRFIALALVVAIMLMGAGYAAWTDNFKVTSTVSTGNLDIQITQAYYYGGENLGEKQRAWTRTEMPVKNANSLVIEAADLYPGSDVRLDIYTMNKGTCPLDFDSVQVEFLSGDRELFDVLTARGAVKFDTDGTGTEFNPVSRTFGYSGDNRLVNLNSMLTGVLDDMILYPGGTLYFDDTEEGCIRFGLPYGASNDYQKMSCKFRLTFNFGQPDPAHGLQATAGKAE